MGRFADGMARLASILAFLIVNLQAFVIAQTHFLEISGNSEKRLIRVFRCLLFSICTLCSQYSVFTSTQRYVLTCY